MYKHLFILITILLTLLPYSSISQGKSVDVAVIKNEITKINLDKNYKSKIIRNEHINDEVTDGGSELIGYYKNGSLKKIIASAGLSYGMIKFEFYYRNEILIFVYEQINSFVYDQKKQELRYDTTERSFEGRYYFKNGKLFDYRTTGHNRFEDDQIDPEKTLLSESAKYKHLLSRKK